MSATLARAAAARLICPCCSKVMRSTAGLDSHVRAKHAGYHGDYFGDASPLIAQTRARYTHAQKCAVVDKFTTLSMDPACKTPYITATKWAFGKVWNDRTGTHTHTHTHTHTYTHTHTQGIWSNGCGPVAKCAPASSRGEAPDEVAAKVQRVLQPIQTLRTSCISVSCTGGPLWGTPSITTG